MLQILGTGAIERSKAVFDVEEVVRWMRDVGIDVSRQREFILSVE